MRAYLVTYRLPMRITRCSNNRGSTERVAYQFEGRACSVRFARRTVLCPWGYAGIKVVFVPDRRGRGSALSRVCGLG